jgi:hypothetical protein
MAVGPYAVALSVSNLRPAARRTMSSESSDVGLLVTSRSAVGEVARHGAHLVSRSKPAGHLMLGLSTEEVVRDSNVHHLTV